MNFVKRSLEKGGTRGRVRASEGVRALLLPTSDLRPGLWALASSSYSVGLTKGLIQALCWGVQDPKAIAKDKSLNVIFSNGLADSLGVELFRIIKWSFYKITLG